MDILLVHNRKSIGCDSAKTKWKKKILFNNHHSDCSFIDPSNPPVTRMLEFHREKRKQFSRYIICSFGNPNFSEKPNNSHVPSINSEVENCKK